MKSFPITVKPFGKSALLIEWPNKVTEEILNDILRFQTHLSKELDPSWEYIPAYNSLTIVNQNESLVFDTWRQKLKDLYALSNKYQPNERFLWRLPVCYDLEFGPDLEEVAQNMSLSVEEVIRAHSSHEYIVYGIGFLPGFMYLGGLPKSLETKRKKEPRLNVIKGSVGLAGKQTGIYPQDSPGGWNIIGNCPIPMFNVKAKDPCFVNVGDKIKFDAIPRAEYELHKIEGEVGIYKPEKIRLDA